ncbi:N-acetyltransferase family protein [Methanoregula sp.]|jgi:GNAT superfamily N-acetyltransferase|uniref:GNAT family N-acetyltransferase n=1 Tax=Methanoregula sp. TaxID=2052170 RepID=UPI003C1FAA97
MGIRELRETDLESLAELYVQFWGERSSLEKMKETFRRLRGNPDYIFLVAEHKGHIAGSLMGIICEELYGECRPFLVIEDVIVDKASRHKGIGSALMRKIETCAISRNCNYIIFVTESERTEALPFYQSLGYSPDTYRGFKKRLGRQREKLLPPVPEGRVPE